MCARTAGVGGEKGNPPVFISNTRRTSEVSGSARQPGVDAAGEPNGGEDDADASASADV